MRFLYSGNIRKEINIRFFIKITPIDMKYYKPSIILRAISHVIDV